MGFTSTAVVFGRQECSPKSLRTLNPSLLLQLCNGSRFNTWLHRLFFLSSMVSPCRLVCERYWITEGDFHAIATAGLNHVRSPIWVLGLGCQSGFGSFPTQQTSNHGTLLGEPISRVNLPTSMTLSIGQSIRIGYHHRPARSSWEPERLWPFWFTQYGIHGVAPLLVRIPRPTL